jgi:hypothetical protein
MPGNRGRTARYAASLPERSVRAAAAVLGGALYESAHLLLPRLLRRSRFYEATAKNALRITIELVGGVEGTAREPAEVGARELAVRKAAGNAAELGSIAAFGFSPLWLLAVAADLLHGSRVYLDVLIAELKGAGVLAGRARTIRRRASRRARAGLEPYGGAHRRPAGRAGRPAALARRAPRRRPLAAEPLGTGSHARGPAQGGRRRARLAARALVQHRPRVSRVGEEARARPRDRSLRRGLDASPRRGSHRLRSTHRRAVLPRDGRALRYRAAEPDRAGAGELPPQPRRGPTLGQAPGEGPRRARWCRTRTGLRRPGSRSRTRGTSSSRLPAWSPGAPGSGCTA